MGLLDGKVVILTGAGRGIGRATALLLARQGASLVLNDSSVGVDGGATDEHTAAELAEEVRLTGARAVADEQHVVDQEQAQALVDRAYQEFGRLDVLINNAGLIGDASLFGLDAELWSRVLDANLSSTFHCSRQAAIAMKKQNQGGVIINTTSRAGLLGNHGQANYAAAGAAIYGLTRTASVELQRYGIRVNAVAPLARTRMTEDLPLFQSMTSMTPEHVAPVHLFLASDLARDVSGMVIAVAGGKVSTFRLCESAGMFKEADGGVWTAEELAESWEAISRQR